MNNQKIEKDNLSIWYVSCFMGIGFLTTEIINYLFFQTTKNVRIRLPIDEGYGNQYIVFKFIHHFSNKSILPFLKYAWSFSSI